MTPNMQGKIALVTGGSYGIGKAAAMAFAQSGAAVIIASRSEGPAMTAVAEIQAAGGTAEWCQTDISQPDQIDALFEHIQSAYGRLDCAFNNAGTGGRGGWLLDIAAEDFDQTLNGYLKSVFLCMKHEIQIMLAQGGGAIVNNSSVDGQRAFPWDPIYSAAKHGVLGLTKSAAVQYIQKGVRINAICPGWIQTPATEGVLNDPQAAQGALMHQPIGRFGQPQEVAQAVVWLCSEEASLIVGTALAVDGGYLAV